MGLSSKKTTNTTKPVYEQEIKEAADISNQTYQNNIGTANDIAGQFAGLVPDLLAKYQDGNATVNAAQAYATDTLNGKYLNNNPYLEDIIRTTNDSVIDNVNAGVGTRGQTGGSAQMELLSTNLADNETGLRWNDYNTERQNMNSMAGLAPGLAAAEQIPLAAAMAAGESAVNLPWVGANNVAANTAGLLGNYTTQTQKTSGGLLGDLLGAGLAGWASGGFAT